MPHLRSDARKSGRYLRSNSAASRRACLTAKCSLFGLIWNTEDRFSSAANCSAITRRNFSAFRRPQTVMNAMTEALQSTRLALGGGMSAPGMGSISSTRRISYSGDERAANNRDYESVNLTRFEGVSAHRDNWSHAFAERGLRTHKRPFTASPTWGRAMENSPPHREASKFVSRLSPCRNFPAGRCAMGRADLQSRVGPLFPDPLVEAFRRAPQGHGKVSVTRGLDSRQAAITSDLCVRPENLHHVNVPTCRAASCRTSRGNS
jgi:hypothetical protein